MTEMVELRAFFTGMENRLTRMENRFDHIDQELQGMEGRIRQDIMYSDHKSIIRSANSTIVDTTANIFPMNLPSGDEPHDMFPRTRQDINTLTSRQIHTLSNAYNMNIRNALPLKEKRELLRQFIGVGPITR